jgi:hypothetical protein
MSITLGDGTQLDTLPNDAATAARVISISHNVCLGAYPHPLPALMWLDGNAVLRGYPHPLPALREIHWYAYLEGYKHALPGQVRIGADACLQR